MKKNLCRFILLLGMSVSLFSACGKGSQSSQDQTAPSGAQTEPAGSSQTLQDGSAAAQAVPSVEAQAVPSDAAQAVPSAGAQAIPSPAAQAVPVSGTQAVPSDAAQAVPSAGAQAVPSDAAQAVPVSGTQAVPSAGSQTASGNILSEAEAKAIALQHAGVAETDAIGMLVRLESDDGIQQYDVEFYSNGMEYDYEINASSGAILDFDHAWDDDHQTTAVDMGNAQNAAANGQFTKEQAIALALSQVPGSTKQHITKCKTDYDDDGRLVYEIEIRYGNAEYDLEIDKITGQLLELDVD